MQTEKTRANPRRPDSQVLTIRIDSKLRYAAELAARRQRRTLSSFIQSALEQATRDVTLDSLRIDMENMGKTPSAYEFAERSWDVNGLSRLFHLAAAYPHLLDHKEEILWSYYREFRGLGGRYDPKLVTETEQLELLKEQFTRFNDWLKKQKGTWTVDEFGAYFQESKKRRTRKGDDLAKED